MTLRARGFTLIEVLVGMLIFVGLIAAVIALFLWGLDGTLNGAAQQLAQQDARTTIAAVKGDVGMSLLPPLAPVGTLPLPSSVVVPSGYQSLPSGSSNDIYTQELPSSLAPTTLQSQNIVAVVIPNQASANFIPSLLQDQSGKPEFGLVVYYVTDSTGQDVTQFQSVDGNGNPVPTSAFGYSLTNPGGRNQPEGGHILWRNVYNLTSIGPLTTAAPNGEWTLDFNQLNGPNGAPVSVGSSPSDPISHDSVVSLAAGDALSFTVSHGTDNQSGVSVEFPYQTIVDRHVFQISVTAQRLVHTHLGNVHGRIAHLSDSVSLRTFQ